MKKMVYQFHEGSQEMKAILGGKGAGLSEMARMGIPVPPGFTISTEVCEHYYAHDKQYPSSLWEEVKTHLIQMEKDTGKAFGDPSNPLLVSVRSGAAVSMPGMMDTILNLGLNDEIVSKWLSDTGNTRFVLDSYRRLLQMFGNVVYDIEHALFEKVLHQVKASKGYTLDNELQVEDLKWVIEGYKQLYITAKQKAFPQDPWMQLSDAIGAVIKSWNNDRAIVYRRLNKIDGLLGTAVNIQSMVFGNRNNQSGTGVCFTRNPSTGEKVLYGEFLINAQGEDVVAGIRTPQKISELQAVMPACYDQLIATCEKLENHYRDMQDIEFTIEDGRLFLLQTRSGKRTGAAAVKVAVDLFEEDRITKEEALMRVQPDQLNQLLHPRFDPNAKEKVPVLAKGLPASPGAAVGKVVFSAQKAEEEAANQVAVILVREETSPEDIRGMNVAKGILTARGGMTSHAAVVARGMGKCCVSGVDSIVVDEEKKEFRTKSGVVVKEFDTISLDGTTGEVFAQAISTISPHISGDMEKLLTWADNYRKLKIRTNADTPKDAEQARRFGAEGIGLCRTEHMFFEGDRIQAVREMILSDTLAGREKALSKILPMQREDFIGIFTAMKHLPVTIRLLDPPLHEFLPTDEKDIEELASELHISTDKVNDKIASLKEFNPMLGHRGCRLGITFPEITSMQTRAIIEAACIVSKQQNTMIVPEIMVPLVGSQNELLSQKKIIDQTAVTVFAEQGITLSYLVGTMIEVPRAALTAYEIAEQAQFFSFGTNDLTQMTFGFSRDDANKFLPYYVEHKILPEDPFVSVDIKGVGRLIKIASEEGKQRRPDLKIGICGEHGGDPASIEFCHQVGLSYVSCSPFRVPIARLAAARAAIQYP